MTQDIRNTTDLSKCAYVSHFDIYRDTNQMYVMPGYVDDMSLGGDADAMKTYDIRAFGYFNNGLNAVGTKSDGTGSKMFYKADPADAEWVAGTSVLGAGVVEGTDNLWDKTYLTNFGSGIFYLTTAGGTIYASQVAGSTVTDKFATIQASGASSGNLPAVAERYYTGTAYMNKGIPFSGVSSVTGSSTFTVTAKSTANSVRDLQTGGEQLGILMIQTNPRGSRLLLWDSASLLIDQNIDMGTGEPVALGYPAGIWTAVINEGVGESDGTLPTETNGLASMSVKVANGTKGEVIYRTYAVTPTNGVLLPTRSTYRDSMLWYARLAADATPTTYREGVWACGKGSLGAPLGISVLLDTSSLGEVQVMRGYGSHYFFVHGGDGSISRLDSFESGTFDVPATYETLVFGADSAFQKELEGVSVKTENLPASASVQMYYRTDVDSAWTSMGTSSTTGKQKHSFTKNSDATPIGKFQEIQFKMVVTGKVTVKNLTISITETDDLPFSV